MVMLLIASELSFNGSDAKRHAPGVPVTGARGLRRGHQNAAGKTMLSGRDRVACAEPWERSADNVLRVSRLRSVREGREGSVVDRPDADTRVLSDALRSVGRIDRPAPWSRNHIPLTWTTAEEEFVAGTRYFTCQQHGAVRASCPLYLNSPRKCTCPRFRSARAECHWCNRQESQLMSPESRCGIGRAATRLTRPYQQELSPKVGCER